MPLATVPLSRDDPRRAMPLVTHGQLARYVGAAPSTIRNWVRGYTYPVGTGEARTRARSEAIVESVSTDKKGEPNIPFIGVAEAIALMGLRADRISLQKIRAALQALEAEIGIENVLANRALYTDGAQILWDYAKRAHDDEIRSLVEPASGQVVFTEAVRQYLRLIDYGSDSWPLLVQLPRFRSRVVMDLHREGGQPILDDYRIPIDEITRRFFHSRDLIDEIAADLDIDRAVVEDVVQTTGWQAAA